MDNFSSGFFAQISYLEEKNAKFWENFLFLGYGQNFKK
jgi:hypothetical protein